MFLSWREYNDIILPFTEGKSISDLVLVQNSSHKPEPSPDISDLLYNYVYMYIFIDNVFNTFVSGPNQYIDPPTQNYLFGWIHYHSLGQVGFLMNLVAFNTYEKIML